MMELSRRYYCRRPNKKSTTPEQFKNLVKLLEPYPELASQIHLVGLKREKAYKTWKVITAKLNALGPPYRKPSEWRKIWTDLRGRTKKKILAKLTDYRKSDYSYSPKNLSSLEKDVDRIVRITESLEASGYGTNHPSSGAFNDDDTSSMASSKSESEYKTMYCSDNDNEIAFSAPEEDIPIEPSPPPPVIVKRKRGRPRKHFPKEKSKSPVPVAKLSPSPKIEEDDDPTYTPDHIESIDYTSHHTRDEELSNVEDIKISGKRKRQRENQNIEILQEQIELQKKFIKLTEQQTAIAQRQADAIEKLVEAMDIQAKAIQGLLLETNDIVIGY